VDNAKNKGYGSVAEFQKDVGNLTMPADMATAASVSSQYFLVWSDTHFGRGQLQLYTLLSRSTSAAVTVLERSQGVY